MPESITRSFFALVYERVGSLALWSLLRALPWLLLALAISFWPIDPREPSQHFRVLTCAVLLAVAVAPWLTGEIYLRAAALARGGEAPRASRRYPILLCWSLIQFALAYLLALNAVMLRAGDTGVGRFPLMLAIGVAFWLWLLARIWSVYFIPLLVARGEALGPTLRLTLRLLLASPRSLFAQVLMRQALGFLLLISGLGLLFGIGALLPLQACLATRIALRPLGLELSAASGPQENLPLPEGPGLGKLWRPWE